MKNGTQIRKKNSDSRQAVQMRGRRILIRGAMADLVKKGAKQSKKSAEHFVLGAVRSKASREFRRLAEKQPSVATKNLATILRSGNRELIRKVHRKIDQIYQDVLAANRSGTRGGIASEVL